MDEFIEPHAQIRLEMVVHYGWNSDVAEVKVHFNLCEPQQVLLPIGPTFIYFESGHPDEIIVAVQQFPSLHLAYLVVCRH